MYYLSGLTTLKTATTVILMVTLSESEKLSTGRNSFSGNKVVSSALYKDLGAGLVQFNAATKPEFRWKECETMLVRLYNTRMILSSASTTQLSIKLNPKVDLLCDDLSREIQGGSHGEPSVDLSALLANFVTAYNSQKYWLKVLN